MTSANLIQSATRDVLWRGFVSAVLIGGMLAVAIATAGAEPAPGIGDVTRHQRTVIDASGNAVAKREASIGTQRRMCHADTAAGKIVVACHLERQMVGFIDDVVRRGFRGRVHCFALGGHVRQSLHYRGEACDFAQRGWGKTVRPMYRVSDLAAKWGLRDGCTFRDCGHIDSGRSVTRLARR